MDPNRLEEALRGLGRLRPPPLAARTETMLAVLAPVPTASPLRSLVVVAVSSLGLAGLGVASSVDHADARNARIPWLVAVAVAWGAGFVACLTAAMIPARRSMLPDAARATLAMVIGPVAMVAFGATLGGSDAGPTAGWGGELQHGAACLFTGLETAAIPFIGGALALRRVLPVDPRAVGAALGAAGGALGALALHLRCGGGALHVAVAHGGAAVVGALLGGAILPRVARP